MMQEVKNLFGLQISLNAKRKNLLNTLQFFYFSLFEDICDLYNKLNSKTDKIKEYKDERRIKVLSF